MGLNPFSSLQPPDSGSEQIVQAKPVVLEEAVERAYKVYESLDFACPGLYFPVWEKIIDSLEKQILSPGQIDSLLNLMISETEPKKLNSSTTGLYLTRLIQDSYEVGYNDFVLTTRDTSIIAIGYNLCGCEEEILRLKINGNKGGYCGAYASYIDFIINLSGLDPVGENCRKYASKMRFVPDRNRVCIPLLPGRTLKVEYI